MKIAAFLFSLLASGVTAAETFVAIDVQCAGLDLTNLSAEEGQASAKLLQDAYNEVHATADNGDRTLTNLYFNVGSSFTVGGTCIGTYCGSATCRLCGPGSKSEFLSFQYMSSATVQDWQRLFRKKLISGSHGAFRSVDSCTIDMHATAVEEMPENIIEANGEMNDAFLDLGDSAFVAIDVQCAGLELNNLSAEEGQASAKLLQDAYNEVHATADNGDRTLTNVNFNVGSSFSLGGTCIGTYCGSATCRLCGPGAVSKMLSSQYMSSTTLQDWQTLFRKKLLSDSHGAFRNVASCNINMHTTAVEEMPENVNEANGEIKDAFLDVGDTASVAIDVQCAGLEVATLSEEAGQASAKLLQDAYNEVHAKADNGDKTLTNVHFNVRSSSTVGGTCIGTYCGSATCRLCGPGAVSKFLSSQYMSSTTVQDWQTLFRKKLLSDSRGAFRNVASCTINMHNAMVHEKTTEDKKMVAVDVNIQNMVKIGVDCAGLELSKLSAVEGNILASALEDTFNHVHSKFNNGDEVLSNVYFNRAAVSKKNLRAGTSQVEQNCSGAYCGSHGCKICSESVHDLSFSDYASTAVEAASSPAHQAWELLLCAQLMMDPHVVFHDIANCKIIIETIPTSATEMKE